MSKKVFISSTCIDLPDVRPEIAKALKDWGYQPIWSESPDFPGTLGPHPHDVCLNAVKEADTYLLIIDKRYGEIYDGNAYPKEDISITWYEAKIAFQERKGIYAFVRDNVWTEKYTYKENILKGNTIIPQHVENTRVFDFIDFIIEQKQWIYQFKNSVELKEKLRPIFHVPSSNKVPHSTSKCNTRRSDFKWCFKSQTLSGAIINQRFYVSDLLT